MVGGEEGFKKNQGFYIYRNKRLIKWGTWFKMSRQEELFKLARVMVDIPNTLDSIWQIDVKKSSANLPDVIKINLCNIIKNIVDKSEKVFTYRGRNIGSKNINSVWTKIDNRGSYSYQINRNHPIVKQYENSLNCEEKSKFEKFLNLIQEAFPYDAVYVDLSKGNITNQQIDDEQIYKEIMEYISNGEKAGLSKSDLVDSLITIEPFNKYIHVINNVREELLNDK